MAGPRFRNAEKTYSLSHVGETEPEASFLCSVACAQWAGRALGRVRVLERDQLCLLSNIVQQCFDCEPIAPSSCARAVLAARLHRLKTLIKLCAVLLQRLPEPSEVLDEFRS